SEPLVAVEVTGLDVSLDGGSGDATTPSTGALGGVVDTVGTVVGGVTGELGAAAGIDEVTVTVGGPGAGTTAPVAVVEVRGTAVGADVGSVADVDAAVPCASVAVLGAGSCAPEGTTGPSGTSGVVGVHLADTRVDAGLGL